MDFIGSHGCLQAYLHFILIVIVFASFLTEVWLNMVFDLPILVFISILVCTFVKLIFGQYDSLGQFLSNCYFSFR